MSLYTTMLESKATLRRPTIARDSAQGVTQDPFTIVPGIVDIPCSVQPMSTNVQVLYAQRQSEANTQIYMTQEIDAQINDVIDARDNTTGVTTRFLVQGEGRRLFGRPLSPFVIDCKYLQVLINV